MHIAVPLLFATLGAAACGPSPAEESVEVEPVRDEPLATKEDRAVGSVELKATVAPRHVGRARTALKLTDGRAGRREVTFYDTPDLALFDAGLVLRARKVTDGADDSTVKLRPADAADFGGRWTDLDGFKCEEDRAAGLSVGSCSLTARQARGEIDAVSEGVRAVDKLFSDDQEALAMQRVAGLAWEGLVPLGPVDTRVWRVRAGGFDGTLTAELWTLPDGEALLEISTKAAPEAADDVAAALEAYLDGKGIEAAVEPESKTRRVMTYFAR